jgi:hypothetical protein
MISLKQRGIWKIIEDLREGNPKLIAKNYKF